MRAEEASDEEIERDPTCLLFLSRLRRYASQTLADHDDELKYPKAYREFVPGDAGIANRFVDAMRIAPAGHRTKLTCLVHAASVFHPAIERALVEPLLAGLLRLKIPRGGVARRSRFLRVARRVVAREMVREGCTRRHVARGSNRSNRSTVRRRARQRARDCRDEAGTERSETRRH